MKGKGHLHTSCTQEEGHFSYGNKRELKATVIDGHRIGSVLPPLERCFGATCPKECGQNGMCREANWADTDLEDRGVKNVTKAVQPAGRLGESGRPRWLSPSALQ